VAIFELSIHQVLRHEGSTFTDDPADPGGATRWGVTLETLRRVRPGATAEDVRELTREDALDVYRRLWWAPLHLDVVVDQQLATKILDVSVNLGVRGGVKLLQRALNACGYHLEEDGAIGPKTLAAANESETRELLLEISSQQAEHYRRWIEAKPERVKFRKGLMARAAWPYAGRAAIVA
jgi:type VI secretion system secreted protein VgrG